MRLKVPKNNKLYRTESDALRSTGKFTLWDVPEDDDDDDGSDFDKDDSDSDDSSSDESESSDDDGPRKGGASNWVFERPGSKLRNIEADAERKEADDGSRRRYSRGYGG